MRPVITAIIKAEITIKNALKPKKPKRRNVIGRFAHGEANRKAITEEVLAPFL